MEQSYKEKYEQAIERLKQWDREHPCAGYVLSDRDKFIFPELADSEDEVTRKEIINYFRCQSEEEPTRKEIHDKWIAWLEKQKEYESTDFEYVWDRTDCGELTAALDKYSEEAIINMCHAWYDKGIELERKSWLEKQDPKKHEEELENAYKTADKVQYKRGYEDAIKEMEKQGEKKPASEEDEPQKELAASYLTKFDEKFPILPTLKGKQLADYKNFLNKCQQIFGLRYWGFRPLQAKLFEKLSLLWAAWGAEHLQGLGQTDGDMDNEISMWSEEDSFRTETLISVIKSGGSIRPELRNEFVNWLKSLRPQSRWKPSDEQIKVCKEVYADILSAKGFDLGTVVSELNRMEEQLKKLRDE